MTPPTIRIIGKYASLGPWEQCYTSVKGLQQMARPEDKARESERLRSVECGLLNNARIVTEESPSHQPARLQQDPGCCLILSFTIFPRKKPQNSRCAGRPRNVTCYGYTQRAGKKVSVEHTYICMCRNLDRTSLSSVVHDLAPSLIPPLPDLLLTPN